MMSNFLAWRPMPVTRRVGRHQVLQPSTCGLFGLVGQVLERCGPFVRPVPTIDAVAEMVVCFRQGCASDSDVPRCFWMAIRTEGFSQVARSRCRSLFQLIAKSEVALG